MFGVTKVRVRERERDHSPSYFANSNLVSWHKYRPIEKFNIVEEFSFLEWRKIQIDGKENSAGMIGEKKMYMWERDEDICEEEWAGYETVARQKIGQSPNTPSVFVVDKKRSDEPADISIRFTGATTTGSCGGPRAVPHVGNALAATTGRLLLLL